MGFMSIIETFKELNSQPFMHAFAFLPAILPCLCCLLLVGCAVLVMVKKRLGMEMLEIDEFLDTTKDVVLQSCFTASPTLYIPNQKDFRSLAKLKHHTVISLFAQVESEGLAPNLFTLVVLINCYCHVGQMTLVFSALGRILKMGRRPNTITLTILMKGLCINNDIGRALDFYDDVIAKGISPDVVTYNYLIHVLCFTVDAFCKEGSITNAEAVVGMMMKHSIKPDLVTCSTLMGGHCLINNVDESRKLFNKMANSSLAFDVISYSILTNGLCKIKMVDDALGLFKEMKCKNLFPNIVTYVSLVDGLCKSGKCHMCRILFMRCTLEVMP
ncbi:pentatricopeptide repeat-containing protein At1g62680, mitochondrial-like [Prosopis cineraria]|uniref:pentatricopeptide repeat-containing protein At1g62680, mitochondrial-like n=1 Tax=Prosopis cineraria TaxID=364024 RepID=UPI00240FD099|nr:pentatricopeptide repeat-containing protein At1g62680, mitochondrial-like [Prosopis cineraria]